MTSAYSRAKYLWRRNERDAALSLLNRELAEQTGAEPFAAPDWLGVGDAGAFESFISTLLTSTFTNSARPFLLIPFGQAWAALWKLDRFDYWIHVLLEYDFFRAPEAIGFDEEELSPPSNGPRDLEAIVEAITTSIRRGELSDDPMTQPNGGLPVLTPEMIDAVDDARWRELKPRLKASLAGAYASGPRDRWARRLEESPEKIVVDFLRDLFGRHASPISAAEARWGVICRSQAAYATAAIDALTMTIASISTTRAIELVRFDAGREVEEGMPWLEKLRQTMQSGSFAALA